MSTQCCLVILPDAIRSRSIVGKVCKEDMATAKEIMWDPGEQVRMRIVRVHPCRQVLDALFELDSVLIARTKIEVGSHFLMGKAVSTAFVIILEDT